MTIALVVAMSENRVIGRDNKLPWHLPADLKYFKELTSGHVVVMGRKTFESIGNKPLLNRPTVVITRDLSLRVPEGVRIGHSLAEALHIASELNPDDTDEVFVLGGSQIFNEALPVADRLYLTLVHAVVEGDVRFPDFDERQWKLTCTRRHMADSKNEYDMSFQVYERA
jgi:dihydrofolate reductase